MLALTFGTAPGAQWRAATHLPLADAPRRRRGALLLASQDLLPVSIGLVITIVGYACVAIGTWQEERRARFQAATPMGARSE